MFDAHVHLDFLPPSGRVSYVRAAHGAGVQGFAVPGVSPARWPASSAHRCFGIGLHPEYLEELEGDVEPVLRKHAQGAAFIGETGLDARVRDDARQLEVFRAHLRVAQSLQLPVVLHVVRRHEEVLRELGAYPSVRAMVHGFVGSVELAERYSKRGMILGIGRRAFSSSKTRRAVQALPLERWVTESDEPGAQSDVPDVVRWMAELRGCSFETCAKQTHESAARFFRI